MVTILKILLLILSMLTIVVAGHQPMIILPFEIISAMLWFDGEFDFNVTGDYDARFWMMGQVTMLAQVVLIVSFLLPKRAKNIASITSCIIFLVFIVIMFNGFGGWNPDWYVFMLGIPVLIPACLLIYKEIKVFGELRASSKTVN